MGREGGQVRSAAVISKKFNTTRNFKNRNEWFVHLADGKGNDTLQSPNGYRDDTL
jgi:hypothetical protein